MLPDSVLSPAGRPLSLNDMIEQYPVLRKLEDKSLLNLDGYKWAVDDIVSRLNV
jgi:hypothetical protein